MAVQPNLGIALPPVPTPQKWGGVRDVGRIEGNPDSIGPNMKPSTWLSKANTGEHGASESGSRAPDCAERKAGMRTFVAGKYETHLKDWWDACQCVWRKKQVRGIAILFTLITR